MRQRTIGLLGGGLLAGALAAGALATAFAQTLPGTGPSNWGPGGVMGPGGMMGAAGVGGYGPGGMMGTWGSPGMMGMMGMAGMMGGSWQGAPATTPTPLASLADARQAFQRSLERAGNADLELDEVMEFEHNFYAIVKERGTGIGAFELLASKQTGAVFGEFGPNMMWNTKYGHMGQNSWMAQMMGAAGYQPPAGALTVSPDQARQIAQQWLDRYQPGSATEAPDTFYGYYTVHTTRDGRVTGMLSVNGYTGQTWYHAWHGGFIAEAEAER